jgi:hypothetical protein
MHKYSIKVSDDGLPVLPCVTGKFKFKPSTNTGREASLLNEIDHLASKQPLFLNPQTVSQYGTTGNHAYALKEAGDKEEYQIDIKVNPVLFKTWNKKIWPIRNGTIFI